MQSFDQQIPWKTKARRMGGFLPITRPMMIVLMQLRKAKALGFPFIPVDKCDPRTLRTLVKREWIFVSPKHELDEARYKITDLGQRVLTVYLRPVQRTDGICPDCGEKPKHVGKTGYVYGYCIDCNRKKGRRSYQLKGNQLNPEGLCARCKKRPRYQYPSGFVIPYCEKCRSIRRKRERKQKHKNRLKRIRQGELILCIRCKAKPIYHTKKTTYDYCHDCYREQQNDYMNRRKAQEQAHV